MDLLERIRKEHGLKKTEMARQLGIGKSYYTMLTTGCCSISKNMALRIRDAFGVSLDEFTFENPEHFRKGSVVYMGDDYKRRTK